METNKTELLDIDSITLEKNSRGYNWKIKTVGTDINKLEELNNEMIKRFHEAKQKITEDLDYGN